MLGHFNTNLRTTYHDVGLNNLLVVTDRLHKEGLIALLDGAVVVDVLTPLTGRVGRVKHLEIKQTSLYRFELFIKI